MMNTANQPPAVSPANSGLSLPTLGLLLGWPLVVAALAAQWIDKRTEAAIEAAFETRPGIAVLDEAAFVLNQPPSGNRDQDLRAALDRAARAADQLTDAGYVVLERTAVFRAPEALHVPSTPIQDGD